MGELLRYRYLFEQMVRRELRQKYQGSVLGVAWYLVNPLVLMGAYYLMFGVVFTLAQHDDYPLFLMVGLVVWTFFSQALLGAAPSLLDQGALIRKAPFPRETIPGAVVTVQMVTFTIVLGLVAIVTLGVRGTLAPALLLLPPVLVALYAFVLGLALAVSVLHAFFRDVAPILSAVLLPWFFLSPIFFEPADITQKEGARFAMQWLNPVAPFIESVRSILYDGAVPSGATLLYVAVAAVVAVLGGRVLFRAMQRELAVIV
ncbi:ABC transporter permease [Paraconexibacter sp.]|uniref:ABC transporter permease n=1 Tax=Paraconexibacter sp. TaxID=2949640 RepID=UPI003563EA20